MDRKHPQLLPFIGMSGFLTEYYLDGYEGHDYYIRYKHGHIQVVRDEFTPDVAWLIDQTLAESSPAGWSDEETTVYLGLISDGIRTGTLDGMQLPTTEEARDHSYFVKGPIPRHCVGLICGDRRHEHKEECYVYVGAEDVDTWINANRPAYIAYIRASGGWLPELTPLLGVVCGPVGGGLWYLANLIQQNGIPVLAAILRGAALLVVGIAIFVFLYECWERCGGFVRRSGYYLPGR
jgi:hypothetical protein